MGPKQFFSIVLINRTMTNLPVILYTHNPNQIRHITKCSTKADRNVERHTTISVVIFPLHSVSSFLSTLSLRVYY